jgi:hypothetical protein
VLAVSLVLDQDRAVAAWTCDACRASAAVPVTALGDLRPPRGWTRGERDTCVDCRFDEIIVGLLHHYDPELAP